MTLLETERLIRKLTDLLERGGNVEVASKLAADYVAACQTANRRLLQCEAMIKAGDRPQAIQSAETPPNLLDWVALLEFHGADDWREYCQENALPAPERIDPRPIQELNFCYAQGITTDHPLYSAYRKAMVGRNDEEALRILQSVTRLNPSDGNAAGELARLDAKVLAVRLKHLAGSVTGATPVLLVAEIETIEAFGFKSPLEGETWQKAQTIRCEYILEAANKLKSEGDWREAIVQLDLVKKLAESLKLQLPAAAQKQREALEAWTQAEMEKARKDREFQSLLAQLRQRIELSEEKDTSARYVETPEIREDYEGMHRVWRALADFTRPIPEATAAQFKKRSALLEGEILRRMSIRRRIIVATGVAVLTVVVVATWLALAHIKARDFSRHLQEAVAGRQVRAADRLLDQAHNEKLGDAAAVAAAETFETKEKGLLTNFEGAFSRLPAQLSGEPQAARLAALADQVAQMRDAFNALAPDLKTENEPRVQAYEKQWQDYLADSGTTVNGLYEQWIAGAETTASGLDYRAPLENTTALLKSLGDAMQKIDDCEAGFTNRLNLRNDLMERAAAVRTKFSAYNGELAKLNDGTAEVQKARTLKEFSDGIKLIVVSEFSAAPAAVAAVPVQSLNADDIATLRRLLGVSDAGAWGYLQKPHPTGFVPDLAMPAEGQLLERLMKDPAVSSHFAKYRLHPEQGAVLACLTIGPFEVTEGSLTKNSLTGLVTERPTETKHIMAWLESSTASSVVFSGVDYSYFNNHLVVAGWPAVASLEKLDDPAETAAFNTVGLEGFGSGSYQRPLLPVLDAIKDSRDGSALFRAYLFLRLTDLMKMQPDAWGLTFCPKAQAEAASIRSIVGGGINSGDWFVPAKAGAYSQKLEQLFASAKGLSYAKEATGLMSLEQAVARDGLKYAGYAGLDGRPNLLDGMAGEEFFGYTAKGELILRMVQVGNGGTGLMPLSPLFALAKPAKQYLVDAGINPGDDSYKEVMPPLFKGITEP